MNKILTAVGLMIGTLFFSYLIWYGIIYGLAWAFEFEFKQKYIIGAMLIVTIISMIIRTNTNRRN